VAIDARNGTILWSVATPDGTIAPGPLAVTNGVVFAPFFGHPYGVLFALESETGKILWQHQLNSSVAAGVSIVDDCVYLPQGISIGTSSVFPSVRGSIVNGFCLT
jgi:outer membrane protein assembly factor BamB